MRRLEFKIEKQRIVKADGCDFSNIIAGTSGYLMAVFSFSDDWNGYVKAAVFRSGEEDYPVAIINNACMIPDEALKGDMFEVNIIGQRGTHRIPTNRLRVWQEVIWQR